MLVFIVARGHPVWDRAGLGMFEWDQAKALNDADVSVVFLAFDCRSIRRWRKFGYRYETIDGIPVIGMSVPLGNINKKLFYRISRWVFAKLYSKARDKYGRPDVIHPHFTNIAVSVLPVSYAERIPMIFTEHSSLIIQETIPDDLYPFYKDVYKNASKIISVSTSLSTHIEKHFGVSSYVIPNIVDTSIFAPLDDCKRQNKLVVVTAGSLLKNKRHDATIRAINVLKDEYPDVKLLICGEGPEHDALYNLIARLGLENNVQLLGGMSRIDLAYVFQNSDFFVLPSSFETFGLVYMEAMATGLPVIATRCGGPEDFVNFENGLLVAVDDQSALENAMSYMIGHYGEYRKERISAFVHDRFSPNAISKQLVHIYHEVSQ